MLDYQGVTQLHHLDLKMYFLLKMEIFQSHVWRWGVFFGMGWLEKPVETAGMSCWYLVHGV